MQREIMNLRGDPTAQSHLLLSLSSTPVPAALYAFLLGYGSQVVEGGLSGALLAGCEGQDLPGAFLLASSRNGASYFSCRFL